MIGRQFIRVVDFLGFAELITPVAEGTELLTWLICEGRVIRYKKSSLPHCLTENTEQEGVFYSDLVFIGKFNSYQHVTAFLLTYGVLLWNILILHLI